MASLWLPADTDIARALREPSLLVPNNRPVSLVKVKPYWLSRGIKSAWLFGNGKAFDVVNNFQTTANFNYGSAIAWGPDYVETTQSSDSFIDIPVFATATQPPYSFLVDSEKTAGIVQWSYLRTTDSWTGIYGRDNGQIRTAVVNDFDGDVTGASGERINRCVAVSHENDNLRLSYRGGPVTQDTSAPAPTTINRKW